jgi:GNAT superfamily N-acetyltransferase
MKGFLARVRDLLKLVRSGHVRRVWWTVILRLYSDGESVGLRRDLEVPFAAPVAKQPVEVRPLAPGDQLGWLDAREAGLSTDQICDRLGQQRLLEAGIGTCHVAIGPDGQPSYMQWLIRPSDNDRVAAFFGNLYPRLAADEALLEGAYTPEAHRGQGIMASAMAQIAERARPLGARWVVTFVDKGIVPSLKGCAKAGFVPYLRRRESFRLFRRRVWFIPIDA